MCSSVGRAETGDIWRICTEDGKHITDICHEPNKGDIYISGDNIRYEVIDVASSQAIVADRGAVILPEITWLDANTALPASARTKTIAMYCTHSDESYEPSDGYYSTRERGTIFQVAQTLATSLMEAGIDAIVADTLHHPHDAGAYRRSRQTAVELLKSSAPDCLIDIHRDGIPDPDSYAVTLGGKEASRIRLLVGRGNQNAEMNKEFALLMKAVADYVYPGLIKDIYMGKGAFNQDLTPRSILFECGTYTLEKERVFTSMPLLADVLERALYGGVVGSAGRVTNDSQSKIRGDSDVVEGAPDPISKTAAGTGSGFAYLGALLLIGVLGFAIISTGSFKRGAHKAARNISEMTGGLLGKQPGQEEDHNHS